MEEDWNLIINDFYKINNNIRENHENINFLKWDLLQSEFFLYVLRNAPKSAIKTIKKLKEI